MEMDCSCLSEVCTTAVGFIAEPRLSTHVPTDDRLLCSWDYPLSRAEKVRRVLQLYEEEAQAARDSLDYYERHAIQLQMQNETLRSAGVSAVKGGDSIGDFQDGTTQSKEETSELSSCNILTASLKGSASLQGAATISSALHPVLQVQTSHAAVTYLCFGQERHREAYILLAAAFVDGSITIFRCYRTEIETLMLSMQATCDTEDSSKPAQVAEHTVVHSQPSGHNGPVSVVIFDDLERTLVTASLDKSVRFWAVDSGELLRIFVAGSPVIAAALLPCGSLRTFVAATAGVVPKLRLVDMRRGRELHVSKYERPIQAMCADSASLFIATGGSTIQALRVNHACRLELCIETVITPSAGVSCLRLVSACHASPSQLLAGAEDASVHIFDCAYDSSGIRLRLTNLLPRIRIEIPRAPGAINSFCYSPSGRAFVAVGPSACSDLHVCAVPGAAHLDRPVDGEVAQCLSHHSSRVQVVASNLQDTLLASADACGRIVFWRRLDFSHLLDEATP